MCHTACQHAPFQVGLPLIALDFKTVIDIYNHTVLTGSLFVQAPPRYEEPAIETPKYDKRPRTAKKFADD